MFKATIRMQILNTTSAPNNKDFKRLTPQDQSPFTAPDPLKLTFKEREAPVQAVQVASDKGTEKQRWIRI
jgi:hypothetical protein